MRSDIQLAEIGVPADVIMMEKLCLCRALRMNGRACKINNIQNIQSLQPSD